MSKRVVGTGEVERSQSPGRAITRSGRATIRKDRRRSESGDTLIEILMALVVLGMASVALIIAFGTSISASADHRQLSATGIALDSISQEVIADIQATPSLFTCPSVFQNFENATFGSTSPAFSVPTGFTATFAASNPIQYEVQSSNSFSTACVAGQPLLVTISVTDTTNSQTFTNSFVVDSPLDTVTGSQTTAIYGAASQLKFTTEPSGGSTGQLLATQPKVTVEDSIGNTVLDDLSPVLLSLVGPGPTYAPVTNGAELEGCSGVETVGVVTFSGCTVSVSGTYAIQATDGDFSGTFDSANFTVSASADYLVFHQEPVAGASGSALTTQPIVYAETGSGTLDSSWSGTITLSASGGSLTNCSALTVTNGKGTFTSCDFAGAYYYNAISGVYLATPYTLTATATNSVPTSPATSTTIQVTGSGSASQLVFSTQPTGSASATLPATFATEPVVTLEDSFGNSVTSSSASVTLTISHGSLGGCGANPVNASGGSASFSGCGGSAYGNGLTLSASSPGLSSTTSASFNITNVASKLIFTTQPVAGVSGTTLETQPVITVEDVNGNTVTASSTAITLASVNSSGTAAGLLQLCTSLTPYEGVVTVQTCNFAGIVGTGYYLLATQGSLTATSGVFSPTASGTATKLVFVTEPVAGLAGSAFTTQPVVDIEDSGGNVTGSSATITLGTSGGTLSSCSNLTAVQGVTEVTSCAFGGLDTVQYTMTATASGLSSATSTSFTPSGPGPASASASTISASPASVSANGSTYSTVTVSLVDAWGNVDPSKSVTLTTAGGNSVIATNPITTNSWGVASFTVSDSTPESVTYGATDFTDGVSITPTTSVIFFGPGTHVAISGCPSSIASTTTCVATATLEDVNGNTVLNYNSAVTFNQTNSGGGSVTGLAGTTNFTNGVANVTLTGNKVGSVTVDAVGDTFTSGGLTFIVTPGPATQVVLSGCGANIASTTTCVATATLEDANGNTVTSYNGGVTFNQTNAGGGSVTGLTGTTVFTNGVANATLTGNKAGSVTLDAVGDGFTSGSVTFIVTPGPANKVILTGCSSTIASNATCVATATLGDVNGNTVTSYNGGVTFNQTNSGGGSVTGLTGTTTFTSGVANVTLTGNKAGSVVIDAVGDSFTSGAVTFNVTFGAPSQVVLSGCTASLPSATGCVATATLEDSNGNTVTNYNGAVTFNQTNSGAGSVTGLTGTTAFTSGVANVTLTGNKVGTVVIDAVGDGFTSASDTFSVTPGAPNKLVITSLPFTATASTSTRNPFTITLEDANGNATTSSSAITVNLAVSPISGTSFYTASTGGTAATTVTLPANNSAVTAYLVDSTSGSDTITVSVTGGVPSSGTQVETINPGPASQIVLSGCTTSIISTGTCVATATLEDTNGNTVASYNGAVTFSQTSGTGSVTGLTGT
ncbi:MAG: invasin domain 3-containing protein, partial [Acidimicrobiales bacterium]